MRLGEKQELFSRLLGDLLHEAHRRGFNVRMGEVLRFKQQAEWNAMNGKGIVNSLHCKKLAVDLNLFKNGKYLTATDDYYILGEWWEKQHELARWGGRFSRPDGGHFSLTHGGVS